MSAVARRATEGSLTPLGCPVALWATLGPYGTAPRPGVLGGQARQAREVQGGRQAGTQRVPSTHPGVPVHTPLVPTLSVPTLPGYPPTPGTHPGHRTGYTHSTVPRGWQCCEASRPGRVSNGVPYGWLALRLLGPYGPHAPDTLGPLATRS